MKKKNRLTPEWISSSKNANPIDDIRQLEKDLDKISPKEKYLSNIPNCTLVKLNIPYQVSLRFNIKKPKFVMPLQVFLP